MDIYNLNEIRLTVIIISWILHIWQINYLILIRLNVKIIIYAIHFELFLCEIINEPCVIQKFHIFTYCVFKTKVEWNIPLKSIEIKTYAKPIKLFIVLFRRLSRSLIYTIIDIGPFQYMKIHIRGNFHR